MNLDKNSNHIRNICTIMVVPVEDISTFVLDGYIATLTMKTGKNWSKIYHTPGSAEFTEKSKDTEAGILFEQILRFQFPGFDSDNNADMDDISSRPLMILLKTDDSQYGQLIGTPDNGARLSTDRRISPESSATILEFYCLSERRFALISL